MAYPLFVAAARSYWLDLFSGQSWAEFISAGANTSGFREGRRKTVARIRPGDYLIAYLVGASRFIGVLEVISEPYEDRKPIWKDAVFPERVKVKPLVTLKAETAVPVHDLLDRFTWWPKLRSPQAWTGYFRGSPWRMDPADGEMLVEAIRDAEAHPIMRPVDKAKLARRPVATRSPVGPATVPEPEAAAEEIPAAAKETRAHTEIQWLLLKLGNDMGLDVWVARNDRGREYDGQRFANLPKMVKELPLKFDPVTNRTIELIDVLWLKGNSIVAAFEVESTTSIYSGLLRMADLIALQPNLNIPLYIVAPDERRDRVIVEVNRPTFRRLDPPMSEVCRYIAFSALRDRIAQAAAFLKHLKPDFIEELAETCDIEEA